MCKNVGLCSSANTTSSYKNSIFGKLGHVLYFQETFQLGPNVKIKIIDMWKKPTNFIICRFQNIGMTAPQVCNSVAFWHWTIVGFINITILLARLFRIELKFYVMEDLFSVLCFVWNTWLAYCWRFLVMVVATISASMFIVSIIFW